jgi:hypothetical protein
MGFLMEYIGKFVWIIVGGIATICTQRILLRLNEKKKRLSIFRLAYKGFSESHRNILYPNLTTEIW